MCTGLHPMCIAQAHSIGSYFILPLAWPSSNSHCIPMTITTTVSHPGYLTPKPEKQSIMQNIPTWRL